MEEQLSLFSNLVDSRFQDNDAGVVFTPIEQAKELILPTLKEVFKKKKKIRVLEPSSGHGSLVFAVILAAQELGIRASDVEIVSNELNIHFLKFQKAALRKTLPKWSSRISFSCSDFLFKFQSSEKFDLVVMNPPWVGYKLIEPATREKIRSDFDLRGQFDLLDPFVIKANQLSNRDGARIALFLPDKVISSHQPSNSLDIVKTNTKRERVVNLDPRFFRGVSHESVFVELVTSQRSLETVDQVDPDAICIEDLFEIFRGVEISGRVGGYVTSDPKDALSSKRRFVSGEDITDPILENSSVRKFLRKDTPVHLIKEQFKYTGPAVLVRKTGSPVKVCYTDSLPFTSQVVFSLIPKADMHLSNAAVKEVARYLQSPSGQAQLNKNSGKLGRALFPYVTISDIKSVRIDSLANLKPKSRRTA